MKTNKKTNRSPIEREIRAMFKDVYNDDVLAEEAVKESIRAFSLVKQDVLYRKQNQ